MVESFVIWFTLLASFSKRGSKFDDIDKSSDDKKNEDESDSEFFKNPKQSAPMRTGMKQPNTSTQFKQIKQYIPYIVIGITIKIASLFDMKEMTEFAHKNFFWYNLTLHKFLAEVGTFGIMAIEIFYVS